MDQRTPEWFSARCGVITASCYADVMAKSETAAYRNYVLRVATERLTGQPQGSDYINAAMEWGTNTEPLALAAYEARTGDLIDPCGLILHPSYPFAGASPDGLLEDDGLVECKCPNSMTHVEYLRDKRLPPKYKPQVMGQLWVTGRRWAHFISYDPRMPERLRLLVVDVQRDDEYIEKLQTAVLQFNSEVDTLLRELTERQ